MIAPHVREPAVGRAAEPVRPLACEPFRGAPLMRESGHLLRSFAAVCRAIDALDWHGTDTGEAEDLRWLADMLQGLELVGMALELDNPDELLFCCGALTRRYRWYRRGDPLDTRTPQATFSRYGGLLNQVSASLEPLHQQALRASGLSRNAATGTRGRGLPGGAAS